jgi:hypothetical protein
MTDSRQVAAALLHYPVVDRQGAVVTTAVTNLDVHDIARSAHTYGLSSFFVVHPVAAQRELVNRIRTHWVDGSGARRIPDRKPAMEIVRIVPSLDEVIHAVGGEAELWTTSAAEGGTLDLVDARAALRRSGPPVVILFGTGWGLAPEVHERSAHRLVGIRSPRSDGYNHLSVRAAAAIAFDRLFGDEGSRSPGV